MKKKILNFLANIAIMYIVLDAISGFKAPYKGVSNLYAGILFALVLIIAGSIRSIVGLKKSWVAKFIFGTVLTFGAFWLVNTFSPNVFSFTESAIGGGNLIFFTIPKILVLQDTNLVILFAALIGNICSIIITKLKH